MFLELTCNRCPNRSFLHHRWEGRFSFDSLPLWLKHSYQLLQHCKLAKPDRWLMLVFSLCNKLQVLRHEKLCCMYCAFPPIWCSARHAMESIRIAMNGTCILCDQRLVPNWFDSRIFQCSTNRSECHDPIATFLCDLLYWLFPIQQRCIDHRNPLLNDACSLKISNKWNLSSNLFWKEKSRSRRIPFSMS